MESKTQKYFFEVNLNLGCDCMGCCMDESINAEVELTDAEVQQLREWLEKHEDADFAELEKELPGLHSNIDNEARNAIFLWAADDTIDVSCIDYTINLGF